MGQKNTKLGITLTTLTALGLAGVATGILATKAHAQAGDKRGFNPPGTSFGNNPFAAKPGAKPDTLFEEDDEFDEEVDDISDEILRQRMEQRLKDRGNIPGGAPGNANSAGRGGRPGGAAGAPSGVDFGEAGNNIGATSMAGGANTKITPGPKSAACLKLDPYTGYGPDVITNFDFPDADIVEIAKTLGRLTCLNFILDKDVKGRISVVSNAQITVGDAWKAFLTALDVNGFSLIPSGAYIRIARQRDAKDKQIKTYTGEYSPDTDLYITRVVPLKYISAEEVARVFRNFMPPNTRIISYDQTNTLIITDTGSNIKKIVDMVQLLDIEGYDEGLEVIRIKYASAQDISKLIDQLLPGSAGGGGQPGGIPGGGIPRFRGSGFAARKTKEGGVISHIIPDDRTNAVIVSANAKGLEQVKELIRKLDARVSSNVGGSKIHVVYLQFADAEQVATTLNNLAAGASAPKPIAAPGAPPASASASLFEGSIKIAADKATNSLVITGTPTDFMTINRVISKLDVQRDQVYVEAVIMEMNINKDFTLGTQIAAPNAGVGFIPDPAAFGSFLTNPLSVSGLVMGFKAGKGNISVPIGNNQTVTVSSIQGLIQALQSNTNSNVLATPQILTLDNQEATIESGENAPIATSNAVQGAGVSTSYSYTKAALTLKIKPQINKISNFVKLDIDQKLEDFQSRPSATNTAPPATTSRSTKTTLVVQDGDTVALGGLMRDNVMESNTKVPLLGDIPILGWLFRSKHTSATKQNLLVFITPKIIKQYQNIRKILDQKIRQRDEFIEKNAGGDDPAHDYKIDMIKGLPGVQDLKNNGRVENAELEPGDEPDAPSENGNNPQAGNNDRGGAYAAPGTLSPGAPLVDGATAPGVLTRPSGQTPTTPIPGANVGSPSYTAPSPSGAIGR